MAYLGFQNGEGTPSSSVLPLPSHLLEVGSLIQQGCFGERCKLPSGSGRSGPLNDICCILAEKKASDESNFTCMFTKNTRKFDKLMAVCEIFLFATFSVSGPWRHGPSGRGPMVNRPTPLARHVNSYKRRRNMTSIITEIPIRLLIARQSFHIKFHLNLGSLMHSVCVI